MDIKTFLRVSQKLPVDISILIRGAHGIGKSQLVHQLGELFKLPVIDRRLSQLSEGDIIGLPELTGDSTRFKPADFVIRACKEPVVLFLDELNRASPEVMQAAFQLVLDRRLQDHQLHPGTRVFAAINIGSYCVNEVDQALLDRFYVVDLEPTLDDWLVWAKDNVHPNIYTFIRSDKTHLEVKKPKSADEVTPSRRSWDRLSRTLVSAGIVSNADNEDFFPICVGFVGPESAMKFARYVRDNCQKITPEKLFSDPESCIPKMKAMTANEYVQLIDLVMDDVAKRDITSKEAKILGRVMYLASGEQRTYMYKRLNERKANVVTAHGYIVWPFMKAKGIDVSISVIAQDASYDYRDDDQMCPIHVNNEAPMIGVGSPKQNVVTQTKKKNVVKNK